MTHFTASESTKIFAHRGRTQGGAPENSLRAFRDAIDAKAHGIEFDIRRTKDNILICVHDPDIFGVPVSQLSWSDIECLNKTHHLEIPTLEEILIRLPNTIRLDMEIKIPDIVDSAVRTALSHRPPNSFVVTSFLDSAIKTIKREHPEIRAGLILGEKNPKPYFKTRLSELYPQHRLRDANADFVVPHWRLLKLSFLKRMDRGGWPVWLWTVNAPRHLQRWLNRPEIEVVISDNVTVCQQALQ